jgi:hypothetical protein
VTVPGLRLGAPGVYPTAPVAEPVLNPERLDVVGFVGVAPRGPVDTPTQLDSWSDYRRRFGGSAGLGLLPHAVHAFFAQGGSRAFVLRVSPVPRRPDPIAEAAVARHRVLLGAADPVTGRPTGGRVPIELAAADEGRWGTQLKVHWEFDDSRRFTGTLRGSELDLPDGVLLPPFSLLRLRSAGLPVAGVFGWVIEVQHRDDDRGGRRWVAVLDGLSPAGGSPLPVEAAVVTGSVTVTDPDPALAREERFAGVGLRVGHARYLADVLATDSELVRPGPGWPDRLLPPDPFLPPVDSSRVDGTGDDRWAGIGQDSFLTPDLDPAQLPVGGPEGLEPPQQVFGVDRMALQQEIGLLAVPDLFWGYVTPAPVFEPPPAGSGPGFAPCPRPVPPTRYDLPRQVQLLDGRTQLDQILGRQRRMVAHAERQRRFVALLDVPTRLPAARIARWRAGFDSSYAAGYHPWLGVVGDRDPVTGRAGPTVTVPPSAFAAGIIAARELRLGLPWGPANELAVDAVRSAEPVTDADHDALHLSGIDVFRQERDGFRLTGARTLSSDPDYRQLTVRRLMTMLRLVLERQVQWLVFEPNTAQLARTVRDIVVQLLRQLFRDGAFAGATEADSFYVRCDDTLNPRWSREQGRLIAEVGVAPSRPLEYLVLRISQNAEGGLGVEADR